MTIYSTRVHATFNNADVFFPEMEINEWNLTQSKLHSKDDRHKFDFHFEVYERK